MKKTTMIFLLSISLTIFIADLYIKWLFLQAVDYQPYPTSQSISVIGDFFKLTYVRNFGITFGLFSNLPQHYTLIILTITSLAALIVLGYFFLNLPKILKEKGLFPGRIALAMIFGGALGNIVDRIIRGFVVDYLDFGINGYRWYVFNLADVFIVSGCILLAILMFMYEIKKEKTEK